MMVCLGNICRSPLAEGIMRDKIRQHELDWEVASSGTGSWHIGEAPDPRSQKIAKMHGIDISNQRAQKFSSDSYRNHFAEFDLIYTMDSSNYQDVIALAINEEEKQKVDLIMNIAYPGMNQNIPDPYYDDTLYEKVFSMLEIACEKILLKYVPDKILLKNKFMN